MKDKTILVSLGILALIFIFAPRLLDILAKKTTPPSADDLVKVIEAANAKVAADKAAADKAAADKAAADAAKNK
jgi:hypothetical protein